MLSAVSLILSFPKYNFQLLAWIAFLPVFFVSENKPKHVFRVFYLTGFIFWLGVIYWLLHVTFVGMIILVLYLALYFAVFGMLISRYKLLLSSYAVLVIPALWVLLEYLRSHLLTGFPWALLGYSQYLNLPLIQISDITGTWGVSFIIMMVNVCIYRFITIKGKKVNSRNLKEIIITGLAVVLSLIYGNYKLNSDSRFIESDQIKISAVQGNIPQELKWNRMARNFIIDKYSELSLQASLDQPDLVIWPEASLPVIVEEEPSFYEKTIDLVKRMRTPLLLGAVTSQDGNYYNSALLISQDGNLQGKYNKLHLVPFGEYIPLRRIFPFLQAVVPIGDVTAGKEYTLFTMPAGTNDKIQKRFSVLICFEDLFPELSRDFIKKGANFLVNITNDAWYKKTSAPYQHLQASVFRAVENRVFLVRSTNTGVTAFIDEKGKIVSYLKDGSGKNIFIDGFDTKKMILRRGALSFYTRYGDVFVAICIFVIICGIIRKFYK